jgi:predicted P-loop ATPase
MNDQQDFTVGNKAPKPEKPRIVNMLALVDHINNTPAWSGALRFNLLTQNYEVCPPFPPEEGAKQSPRPLDDPYDILLATMYFQANGFAKANKTVVWDAITAVAHEYAYHPVRDYLNGVKWDGVERVGKLFQGYFKAKLPDDTTECDRLVAYLDHASTCFLVSAVARAMKPGCKADYIPVVVGRQQGLLKSTAIRALCHDPAWFSDDISTELIDRDTKESLSGKWIVELAEIPHIRRETEKMKAFFSRREDRYRAAYGRGSKDHPRQGVFIGTSNDLEFVDVTGNRRFWPFISDGEISIETIERDRDQLWAEAVHLYRQGVQWWLPPTIEKLAVEQQARFAETDVWDEIIAKWIDARGGQPFTMADLFARDTGIRPFRDTVETSRAEEMRAGRCLKRLRWYASQCTLDGKRARWWKPL